MEFVTTPERTALRQTVRRAVTAHADEPRIRAAMESADGFDADLWHVLADLGVTALHGPDRFGDLAVVLEELGRGPVCAPMLGTAVLAPALLTACGTDAAAEVLARLNGTTRATASLESVSLTAHGNRVDGIDAFVVDAPGADVLVLPARVNDEIAIFAVECGAAGLICTTLTAMDQTRRIGRLELHDVPAVLLASGDIAAAALSHARDVARAALASEQVGGAARCVELTVEYVRSRRQFGVPIGTFQAVKHLCADLLVAVEFARSAAEYAAYCVDHRPDDLPTASLVAGSLCSQNYLTVTEATVQLHGGIGFTWDNYAHLFFKRAKSTALMFGQPSAQRAELASLIGV